MVVVEKARTIDDFREVEGLSVEMGRWEVAQCAALGIPSGDVIPTYYADDAVALMEKCTLPGAGMYLALSGSMPLGCVGFTGHGEVAEITKFFVRPAARGQGAGSSLLASALRDIEQLGYRRARLVTTSFMPDAVALYGKFGFVACAPFAPAPASLGQVTRYMEKAMG